MLSVDTECELNCTSRMIVGIMGLAVTKQEAFWEACGFGNKERVRKFIEEGVDVNWVSYTVSFMDGLWLMVVLTCITETRNRGSDI